MALPSVQEKARLLQNPTRASILNAIERQPGSTVAALSRLLSVTHQTISYHLKFLKKAGCIVDLERGNRRLHFVNGSGFGEENRRLVALASDAITMAVLDAISKSPWILRKEVPMTLGLSRTAGAWHINKLVRLGLVREAREKGHSFLFVNPAEARKLRAVMHQEIASVARLTGELTGTT